MTTPEDNDDDKLGPHVKFEIGPLFKPPQNEPIKHWWNKSIRFSFDIGISRVSIDDAEDIASDFCENYDIRQALNYLKGQQDTFETYFAGYYLQKENREVMQIIRTPQFEAVTKMGKIGSLPRQLITVTEEQDSDARQLLNEASVLSRIMSEKPDLSYQRFWETAIEDVAFKGRITLDFSDLPTDVRDSSVGSSRGIQSAANLLSSDYVQFEGKPKLLAPKIEKTLNRIKTTT